MAEKIKVTVRGLTCTVEIRSPTGSPSSWDQSTIILRLGNRYPEAMAQLSWEQGTIILRSGHNYPGNKAPLTWEQGTIILRPAHHYPEIRAPLSWDQGTIILRPGHNYPSSKAPLTWDQGTIILIEGVWKSLKENKVHNLFIDTCKASFLATSCRHAYWCSGKVIDLYSGGTRFNLVWVAGCTS
jgi:hypothetical protein